MQINLHEAKAKLSALVEKCRSGEEVIIAKAGKPLARLVKYEADPSPRKLGLYKNAGLAMGKGIHDGDAEIATMFGMED
ncbi:type II toxin-antitoxin system prevent-host-death family antitoxin [uncultured Cohaesibacter sp.]|uniref:type II toxin-antitoxin system Phd/YefM family antitoxin n=1 Tax=uncultured Cohaesibacter sp. TaxID=1002546 RepID=UPI00292D4D90|nr:type II toxin-antitoxin system prevent-host-death family antitoxin [uncultured Cohaesibacter sp.]